MIPKVNDHTVKFQFDRMIIQVKNRCGLVAIFRKVWHTVCHRKGGKKHAKTI